MLMLKTSRNLLIWTLSWTLAVQPALAKSSQTPVDLLNPLFKHSQINRGPQKFSDFLKKNKSFFSSAVFIHLSRLSQAYPDLEMPRIDVNKLSGPEGDVQLQFSASMNGMSAIMLIAGSESELNTKVQGQKLELSSDQDPEEFFAQFGVKKSPLQILKAEQLKMLSKAQQQKYILEVRALLRDVERVQNAFVIQDVSQIQVPSQFFANVFLGAEAFASDLDNKDCLVAGWVTKVGQRKDNSLSCGGGDTSFLTGGRREGCQSQGTILCQPAIFGNANPALCVKVSKSSTAECVEKSKNNKFDAPYDAKSQEDWDKARNSVLAAIGNALDVCGTTYETKGISEDQSAACKSLAQQQEKVAAWDCDAEHPSGRLPYCHEPFQSPVAAAAVPVGAEGLAEKADSIDSSKDENALSSTTTTLPQPKEIKKTQWWKIGLALGAVAAVAYAIGKNRQKIKDKKKYKPSTPVTPWYDMYPTVAPRTTN
jgi:hypothetical protein